MSNYLLKYLIFFGVGTGISACTFSGRHIASTGVPLLNRQAMEETVWKGERVNMQLALWGTKEVRELKIGVSDLVSPEGASIPASVVKVGFDRYMMTDDIAGGCTSRRPGRLDPSLVADAIDVIPSLDIPAYNVRPVWIRIEVPEDVKAGKYRGTIAAEGDGEVSPAPLELTL